MEIKKEISTLELGLEPNDLIKDPYVLEFLALPDSHRFSEGELEIA